MHTGEEIHLVLKFLVGLYHFAGLVDAAVEHLYIGEDQLQVDGLNIAGRVDAALYMHNVVVDKAAHHMHNGVYLTDIRQEFIAQPFALGGPAHQARNIHKLNGGGGVLLRVVHFRQLIQALVRHGDDADIGLNGAERIICGLRPRVGNGVEQGALAHVRQAHDS